MAPATWPSLVPGGLILAAAAGCRERLAWVAWGSGWVSAVWNLPFCPSQTGSGGFSPSLSPRLHHPLSYLLHLVLTLPRLVFAQVADYLWVPKCMHTFQPDDTDLSVESNAGETSLCPSPGTPHTCWPRGVGEGPCCPIPAPQRPCFLSSSQCVASQAYGFKAVPGRLLF